jgi:hypothetical protein
VDLGSVILVSVRWGTDASDCPTHG